MSKLILVAPDLVNVKALSAQYGISKSTIYELIKSDSAFPYKNVGLKKKLMVNVGEFENWLNARTERQKDIQFRLPAVESLVGRRRR